MEKNGYTTKELLVVIIVLGLFTIGILSSTSYAYKDRSEDFFSIWECYRENNYLYEK